MNFLIEMAYGLFHTTIQNITKKLGVSTRDALVNHLICFTLMFNCQIINKLMLWTMDNEGKVVI